MLCVNYKMAAILAAIEQHGFLAPREIAEHAHIAYRSLYNGANYLRQLQEAGLIHIAYWERQTGKGGPPWPVYAFGEGRSARYPGAKSYAEKYAKYKDWRERTRTTQKAAGKGIFATLLGV